MCRVRFGLVLLLAVAGSLVAVPSVASARTIDSKCDALGSVRITPGVGQVAGPQDFAISGGLRPLPHLDTSCPPVSPTETAMFSGTLHTDSMYCAPTLSFYGDPPVGRVTITWPDAVTSLVRMRLTPLYDSFYGVWDIAGKVLSGRFAGDHVSARIGTTTIDYPCGGDPVGFFNWRTKNNPPAGRTLHLRPVVFSHP